MNLLQPTGMLKECTLTPAQEKYVWKNYKRMSIQEMARNQRMNFMKISRNMAFLKLEQPRRAPVASKRAEPERPGIFNIDRYARTYLI